MHKSLKIVIWDQNQLTVPEKNFVNPKHKDNLFFIATVRDYYVGYLEYNKQKKQLINLFVRPEFRNMRIAKSLLHTAVFLFPEMVVPEHPYFLHNGYKKSKGVLKLDINAFDIKMSPYIKKYKNYYYNAYNGCIVKLTKNDFIKNKRKLFELGYYVPLQTDFYAVFRYFLRKKKQEDKNSITLVTTEACNLNCPYCFEKNKQDEIIIDVKQYKQIWNKIKPHIKNGFRLNFFGGEPFLNDKAIYYFTDKLRAYCKKKHYKYSLGVITNGTIFKKEYSSYFKSNEFGHIQITLDGDKQEHNKTRGEFDKIIRNTHKFLKKTKTLGLRINVIKDNINSILPLFKRLSKEYNSKERNKIFVSLGFVYDEQKKISPSKKEYQSLISKLIKHNFFGFKFFKDPRWQIPVCPAAIHSFAWIDLQGKEYFCEHQIGNRAVDDDFEIYLSNNCVLCKYFPVCGGQCWASNKIKEPIWSNCILIKAGVNEYLKRIYNTN